MYGASLCEHCEPSLSSALLAEMKAFKVKNLVFKLFWYCSSSIFMTKVFFFFIFFFFLTLSFFFTERLCIPNSFFGVLAERNRLFFFKNLNLDLNHPSSNFEITV